MKKKIPIPSLKELKKVHVIAICGTLMGNFSIFLKSRGIHVTGSDQNIYPPMSDLIRGAGIEIYNGFHADHLNQDGQCPDLVVIGNAVRRDNPEAQAVMKGEYAYCSLPEFMEKFLLPDTTNLVVSGTHGKTTTASLLAHVLVENNKDPSYFFGGVCQSLPSSFHVGQGACFVLEGDEYDTAFWDKVPKFNHYLPNHTILTSVEYDHADIYPDMQAVMEAFEGLVKRVRQGGHIIACVDYPPVEKLLTKASTKVITYGRSSHVDYQLGELRSDAQMTHFDVKKKGSTVAQVSMSLSGTYNALNALSVWLECRELGIPNDSIVSALMSFKGVKRRQEVRGQVNGVTIIDDFAHHPTAVRETVRGLKQRYNTHKLIIVFEPRSATSRRRVFQEAYTKAFDGADQIFIAKAFDQSKIDEDERFSSEDLVEALNARGLSANLLSTQTRPKDQRVEQLFRVAKEGDVLAVLSNGGFDGLIPNLLSYRSA